MIVIDYYTGVFYIMNWGTLNFKTRENIIKKIKEISPDYVEFDHKGNYLKVTGYYLPARIMSISSEYRVLLE